MPRATIVQGFLAGAFLVGVFGSAQGCGVSSQSYCEKACDCQGCKDLVLTSCPEGVEDARRRAKEKGCTAEFDAALGCLSSGQCVADRLDASACQDQEQALAACGVRILGTDACQMLANHQMARREECGIEVDVNNFWDEPSGFECYESLAVQAECIDACIPLSGCACLKAPDDPACDAAMKPFLDCGNACLQ